MYVKYIQTRTLCVLQYLRCADAMNSLILFIFCRVRERNSHTSLLVRINPKDFDEFPATGVSITK